MGSSPGVLRWRLRSMTGTRELVVAHGGATMWIGSITAVAVACICALYAWQVYEFSVTFWGDDDEQTSIPLEHADWDTGLLFETGEFSR